MQPAAHTREGSGLSIPLLWISMKVEEPTDDWPARVPASPEVVALATELVQKFSECFWFRHPEARIRY